MKIYAFEYQNNVYFIKISIINHQYYFEYSDKDGNFISDVFSHYFYRFDFRDLKPEEKLLFL